ncbi:MAG: type II toxin-antitoxin system RelE/ParE family toxin [Deltaproteobacteria bacterium]|nr:MAG: type II toxin-antitoxin system RelE/ParE family toxin [Deltaproteobacteria bacterium]
MKIVLTELAAEDLEQVELYIRRDNPSAAVATVLRIIEAIEVLPRFPNLGRPGRVPGTRELVVGGTPYLAVYRVKENTVFILRVLHSAMKWPES